MAPESCRWILDAKAFKSWYMDKKIFWIFGKPGSGKTYLAQTIFDHLTNDEVHKGKNSIVLHFFFSSKTEAVKGSNSMGKFYRTILHQLLRSIPPAEKELWSGCLGYLEKETSGGDFDADTLIRVIKHTLDKLDPAPVYLVVDALDECTEGEDGSNIKRDNIMEWLKTLKSLPRTQVLITSRPLEKIEVISQYNNESDSEKLDLSSHKGESSSDIQKLIEHSEETKVIPPGMPRLKKCLYRKSKVCLGYTP